MTVSLKGNSAVKTNKAQIKVHTFNKLFPKNLGPNHFSKREIVPESYQIIQISTPCCSFQSTRESGQPDTRVKTHKLLRVCEQVVTSLFTSCQQVVFALLVPSLL